ncbi:hypothetical protein H4Q32_018781 [Labeo rohita]|uniref:Core-binding (CB) domain-containing protein n=1 Tax=Labeo rohita TaxID=84645 RepID=A0ABQ8LEL2_LABRO|nr:hypothetical protein H4Q32_018781 [Labeo rohita]
MSSASASPHRQHSDGRLYQSPRGFAFLSYVATRLPSPPLESEVAQIATCRSHSRRAESCSGCALTPAYSPWRMVTPSPSGPAYLELIRGRLIDLFASPESAHSQLFYSLTEAPLGTDALARRWPRGLTKYAFPPVSLLAQTLCKIREDKEQVLLVAPYWPTRTWFPELMLLATAPSWKIPLRKDLLSQGMGTIWHSRPDLWNLNAVVDTITQARAPSTRQAYALRWGLFVDWCSSRQEDPQRCSIGVVLSFLQEKLERRLSPSTLKVYVAAIAAYHDAVDGLPLGRHHLIVRFLRGVRRLNPPSFAPHPLLGSLCGPYWPSERSLRAAGIIWAGFSHACLRPRPGYVSKVPTTPFRDQVVNLQALPPEEADPALGLLCPVRALRIYVDRTRSFRRSEQLFVCFGGQQKGNAVSKQRLAHWVVDAITLAYQCQGEPCPLGVRAHSTRSLASFYALAHGASLADIYNSGSREDGSVSACCAIPLDQCAFPLWFAVVNPGSSVPAGSN